MTVTYSLTTNVGKVRLQIGDTTLTDYKFTDEELTYFLSLHSNNVDLASAEALEAWAASYGAQPDSEKIGDYAYTQKIVDRMLKLAATLRAKVDSAPVLEIGEMDLTYGSGITEEGD